MIEKLQKQIADLQAEIERLKENEVIADGYADALVEYTKAEAYKEFAEKVNKMLNSRASFSNLIESITCESIVKDIDNLLKELIGE